MLAGAGAVALVGVPASWSYRLALAALWCAGSGFELWWRWRRYRGVTGFRLHADGSVDIEAPDGTTTAGVLAAGTVSLAGVAWFRCRAGDGRSYNELIRRSSQERDDWRRFRVICRHVSAC